jgi:hypothetical protein
MLTSWQILLLSLFVSLALAQRHDDDDNTYNDDYAVQRRTSAIVSYVLHVIHPRTTLFQGQHHHLHCPHGVSLLVLCAPPSPAIPPRYVTCVIQTFAIEVFLHSSGMSLASLSFSLFVPLRFAAQTRCHPYV